MLANLFRKIKDFFRGLFGKNDEIETIDTIEEPVVIEVDEDPLVKYIQNIIETQPKVGDSEETEVSFEIYVDDSKEPKLDTNAKEAPPRLGEGDSCIMPPMPQPDPKIQKEIDYEASKIEPKVSSLEISDKIVNILKN